MKKAAKPAVDREAFDQRVATIRESRDRPSLARRRFRALVWQFYSDAGRVHPWRKTNSWYRILLSEFMLQQTQVERVLPKYKSFLRRFPTARSLADASLAELLAEWQGLGYNRRALALQRCCQAVIINHGGRLPEEEDLLLALPGIGQYTAAALQAFVFEKPVVVVETNIRTVFYHCFLWQDSQVEESVVQQLAAECLDRRRPREWYYALMDLGSYLKSQGFRYNARFTQYRKQAAFEGSNRQLRGAIIRVLTNVRALGVEELQRETGFSRGHVSEALQKLQAEGLIARRKGAKAAYYIPKDATLG